MFICELHNYEFINKGFSTSIEDFYDSERDYFNWLLDEVTPILKLHTSEYEKDKKMMEYVYTCFTHGKPLSRREHRDDYAMHTSLISTRGRARRRLMKKMQDDTCIDTPQETEESAI